MTFNQLKKWISDNGFTKVDRIPIGGRKPIYGKTFSFRDGCLWIDNFFICPSFEYEINKENNSVSNRRTSVWYFY